MSLLKIQRLESKIADLNIQYQQLLEQRHQEIAGLVSRVGLQNIDNKTLVGGFLHLAHHLRTTPSQKEAWHQAGQTFLTGR